MKAPLILSLAALALSTIALAALLMTLSSTDPGGAAPAGPVAADPTADLRAEVQELGRRVEMLALHQHPEQPMPVLDGLVSQDELDALRDELAERLARRSDPTAEVTDDFKQQVAATLSEIRKEETVAAARNKQEQRAAKLDEQLPLYAKWLDLTPYQTERLRAALAARYDREAELLALWEAGADDELLGEQKADDRQTFLDELGGILTPEQYETYTSSGK
jgi:parvulin-like peptidyl-prolyl isomerase